MQKYIALFISFIFSFQIAAKNQTAFDQQAYSMIQMKKSIQFFNSPKYLKKSEAFLLSFYKTKNDRLYFQKLLGTFNEVKNLSVSLNTKNEVTISIPHAKTVTLSGFKLKQTQFKVNGKSFELIHTESLESALKRLNQFITEESKTSFFNLLIPKAQASGSGALAIMAFVGLVIFANYATTEYNNELINNLMTECEHRDPLVPYKESDTYLSMIKLNKIAFYESLKESKSCEQWAISYNEKEEPAVPVETLNEWCITAKKIELCVADYKAGRPPVQLAKPAIQNKPKSSDGSR